MTDLPRVTMLNERTGRRITGEFTPNQIARNLGLGYVIDSDRPFRFRGAPNDWGKPNAYELGEPVLKLPRTATRFRGGRS